MFDASNSGEVRLSDLRLGDELIRMKRSSGSAPECKDAVNSSGNPGLHWDLNTARRALGELVQSVNHIAIIVSDVGRSIHFYSDVVGLQQIHRPNFDNHGAWFTMGN